MRVKIESIKPANVLRVRKQWSEIAKRLNTAVTFVHRWSYSGV